MDAPILRQRAAPSRALNRSKTRAQGLATVRAMSHHAIVSLGASRFRARIESTLAPASCSALLALLPHEGRVLHARWSGEALWSPLGASWPAGTRLRRESATSRPQPGQLLLYAGRRSEPELLLPYGPTRFACAAGALAGNPVLTILERLEELERLGRSILERGATSLRIEPAS